MNPENELLSLLKQYKLSTGPETHIGVLKISQDKDEPKGSLELNGYITQDSGLREPQTTLTITPPEKPKPDQIQYNWLIANLGSLFILTYMHNDGSVSFNPNTRTYELKSKKPLVLSPKTPQQPI